MGEGGIIYWLLPLGYLELLAASLLIALVSVCFKKARQFGKATFVGALLSIPGFILSIVINWCYLQWFDDFLKSGGSDIISEIFGVFDKVPGILLILLPFVIELLLVGLGFYWGMRVVLLRAKRSQAVSLSS